MKTSRPFVLKAACAFTLVVMLSPARVAAAGGQDTPPAPPPETPPAETPPAEPQETPPAPPAEAPPQEKTATGEGANQPAGETPAAPAAKSDAPTDAEDAAARAILEPAAKRQGGETLAPPEGRLDSFHIVFHKVTIHRLVEKEDGSTVRQRIDSESPGLILDWKLGQIRTEWHLSGETPVIRGVMRKANGEDYPWLWDGAARRDLRNAGYERDLAEIERDRRIVKAMLQASVLRAMLQDGSRWKVLPPEEAGAGFAGTAIRRTPPKSAETPLRLTVWIDPATSDVTGARLEPNVEGESTMFYGFAYLDAYPKVTGDAIRFPARFRVMEQRAGTTEPVDVMDATASQVSFNDVLDDTFKPPKK